jgi:hypothetical protein
VVKGIKLMNISGIRPYSGLNPEIYTTPRQDVTASNNISVQSDDVQNGSEGRALPDRKYNSFDYSKQYRSDAVYSMKGSDSDLSSLDVVNRMDEIHKDFAMKQYRNFVGNDAPAGNTADVHPSENFDL